MSDIQLHCGNCLDILPGIESGSVDMVLCDLPFGTTNCHWDVVIPFAPLWEQYRRIIKPNGAIVLFANQPFTTDLIQSNREWFRYCYVWDKVLAGGHLNANRRPLKVTEDICVFSRDTPPYYPQMTRRGSPRWKGGGSGTGDGSNAFGAYGKRSSHNNQYYPTNLLTFSNGDRTRENTGDHPTQKPVALCSYLIRTYTNEGETVCDNTMGSGSTLVACVETDRHGIGIEKDESYFALASRRIAAAQRHKLESPELPFSS